VVHHSDEEALLDDLFPNVELSGPAKSVDNVKEMLKVLDSVMN